MSRTSVHYSRFLADVLLFDFIYLANTSESVFAVNNTVEIKSNMIFYND